jgi:16S rRNA (guanine527-N7)-methyltransferase
MTHAELLAAGYRVSGTVHARLARFVELLQQENRRINLTAIRGEAETWSVHVCDSLALLPLIHEGRSRTLVDLGTGGGLPGVPLACACPDLVVTLVDATQKKLTAVGRIVQALALKNVRFAWGRAEVLAHDPAYREQFDAATARALAELRVLVEYGAGFVRPGGVGWFFKTRRRCESEVPAAQQAARACAMEFTALWPYYVPPRRSERIIAIYRKLEPLRASLPRRTGRPAKRPM